MNENSLLMSLIIPTYNTQEYIKQCIESFEVQDFKNYEIIVSDDGSTDNTIEIVEDLIDKYKNIKIFKNNHIGVGNARNHGLNNAKGKYVYFSDSDDYVSPDFFNEICYEINENESDIIFFGYNELIDDKFYKYIPCEEINSKYELFYGNSCIWREVFKRDVFIKNKIEFPIDIYHQDDAVFFRLIESANKISCINRPLYNYRKNRPGSSMNTKSVKYYNDIVISSQISLENLKNKMIKNDDLKGSLMNVYTNKLMDYAIYNLAYTDKEIAKKYYNNAVSILNDYFTNWKNSTYFSDNDVAVFTKILRKLLKSKYFYTVLNVKLFKNILKRRMVKQ